MNNKKYPLTESIVKSVSTYINENAKKVLEDMRKKRELGAKQYKKTLESEV